MSRRALIYVSCLLAPLVLFLISLRWRPLCRGSLLLLLIGLLAGVLLGQVVADRTVTTFRDGSVSYAERPLTFILNSIVVVICYLALLILMAWGVPSF